MSEAGIQILNAADTFTITDKNPTLHFITKGTITCGGWGNPSTLPGGALTSPHNVAYPSGYECEVIAYRATGNFMVRISGSTHTVYGDAGVVVTWYMFARATTSPAITNVAGLVVFDANGKCCFDSRLQVAYVEEVIPFPSYGNSTSSEQTLYTGGAFPGGRTCAVVVQAIGERVYQPTNPAPTSPVRYYEALLQCNTNLVIKEKNTLNGTSDTLDRGVWTSGAYILVDVTGF